MRKSVTMGLIAGVLSMGLANAEIKVGDQLSLSGFLDMSSTAGFPDVGAKTYTATFDQFELDFMYKFSDKLSARADINSAGTVADGTVMKFEQGFLSYAASSALTVQAGKFLSSSGWEAAEPTGMYQYSWSDALVYGGYQNGVNASYVVSPMISVYAAYVDGIWIADGDMKRAGYETQVALMPTKEITVKVTGMYEQEPGYGKSVLNAWGSYVTGPLTAALEGDYLMNYAAEKDNGIGYLAMVNYKLSDVTAVTGRFSGMSTSGATSGSADDFTQNEITVSPSYALAPNWLILAEAKYQLDDSNKGLGLAVETTVTF